MSIGGQYVYPTREIESDLEDVPTQQGEWQYLLDESIRPVPRPKPSKISIVGTGSSYRAGLIGKNYFEKLANIPTEVKDVYSADADMLIDLGQDKKPFSYHVKSLLVQAIQFSTVKSDISQIQSIEDV